MVLNLRVGRDTTPSVTSATNYSSDDDSFFVRTTSSSSSHRRTSLVKTTTTTKTTTLKQTHQQYEQPELTYYLDQHAVLRCRLKNENDQIVWLKDNRHIFGSNAQLDDEKYDIKQEGPERQLIIKNLNFQDSGSYSCHSRHKPTSKVEFKMNVKGNSSYKYDFIEDFFNSNIPTFIKNRERNLLRGLMTFM